MTMFRTFALLAGAGLAALATAGQAVAATTIVAGFNANTLAANDDDSTGLVNLGFNFNFYGTTYTQAYINNNGNMTFSSAQSAFTPFAITGATGNPMLAPFFADVDTTVGSVVTYGTGMIGGQNAFGVNWPDVGYFNEHIDLTNNFQLLLVDRSDLSAGDADIYFNYGAMQWETGDYSDGSGGFGGTCARVGYNNGAGTAFEVAGSSTCGALIDGGLDALSTSSNNGTPGQQLFQVRDGIVVITETPEPASLALLGVGVVVLGAIRRRRR